MQHYSDRRHNNWLASLMMPVLGFRMGVVIGPLWKKAMTPPGGSLSADFESLLELEFEHILPGHGSLLRGGAKQALREAVERDVAPPRCES